MTELIDGRILPRDSSDEEFQFVGPKHSLAIMKLSRLALSIEALGSHLRMQVPIRIAPNSQLIPDGAVVRGKAEDFAEGNPFSEQIQSVLEIAHHSLNKDRSDKQRVYAQAGILQYVIINLPDQQVEVYEGPNRDDAYYARVSIVKHGRTFGLRVDADKVLEVAADCLL